MELTFTPAEAQVVLGFLSSVLVPIVTSMLVKPSTNKYIKFALAAVLSLLGGALTVYIGGGLTGSVLVAGLSVFMAAQANYASWFKGTGMKDLFEDMFPPKGLEVIVDLEDKE